MTSSHTTTPRCQWFSSLASALDPRSAPRLALLLLGAVLARGRRTVTSWVRAAGLSAEYRPCYTAVAAAGARADRAAARLAVGAALPLAGDAGRVVLAIDDTPTARRGRRVQGAGVHHNPCAGPADGPYVYGHVWVVLALLVKHARWGVVALPLLARLYVRKKDLSAVPPAARPAFRTKLEMAAGLLRWAAAWLASPGRRLWLVADGAYAKAPVLKEAARLGVTVVSRLRKDAALRSLPGPRPRGRRGRPRVYGERRVELAKRAGQRRGWASGTFRLYGKDSAKRYKTFVATWRPAGGAIRVVLVDEPRGAVAFFCTDVGASVTDVLGLVADRFSLETAFRDLKQAEGAGQQQVRRLAANVGAFHVCLWAYTAAEAWAWGKPDAELADRSGSPWDDASRRPSHADKRNAWRRQLLGDEIMAALRAGQSEEELAAAAERLLDLAA